MATMRKLPDDHPLITAWEQYKQTDEYLNSAKWATHPHHLEGSLWALFMAGWEARERALMPIEIREHFKLMLSEIFWRFHPRRNRFCKKCGQHIGNSSTEAKAHVCT